MTLDVYSDLVGDDRNAVADRLDQGLAATDVVEMWSDDESLNG
ncbi:hypothetical protein [Amnibacterium sp.]|nr:hypothetical protein [Amnibacterium sp.]MCU1472193.1 hypothetical protein [Amnibacterium sp.]